jgi:NADH:ubiquinone oxidoreductase subunit 5 (subunit L)/multisubunit Na+/H+ antiporter MnhA subunit
LNFGIIGNEYLSNISPALATVIALLLFAGAVGKSAQVPLHVWLPDAMEGPTPVSALIHAATMVAAGVFLLARFHFLFALSPTAQTIVAWTGGITALGAALSALTATDIKKVLAYSTISQLGFMVLAMGVGDPQAGMFHLTTHAFFKALLFLGAGSVIHAVHTNEMPLMGGLAKKLPITAITMFCAWLAIIGFPYVGAGFYSKEAILAAIYESHHPALFAVAGFTAFLTTFYMTRLMLLTFWGTPRDGDRFGHAHESGPTMAIPLWFWPFSLLARGSFWNMCSLFTSGWHLNLWPLPWKGTGAMRPPSSRPWWDSRSGCCCLWRCIFSSPQTRVGGGAVPRALPAGDGSLFRQSVFGLGRMVLFQARSVFGRLRL